MSELTDKIAELKAKYPTLTKGVNDKIVDLSKDEYEATIGKWAEFDLTSTPNVLPIPKAEQSTPNVVEHLTEIVPANE